MKIIHSKNHIDIRYSFSNRHDGDMRSSETRNSFLSRFSLEPTDFVHAKQVHSGLVAVVRKNQRGTKIDGVDGFVASVREIPHAKVGIGIMTADCVPVLFYDAQAGVVGAAHAGWRGIQKEIILHTLDAMETIGATIPTIHVCIGPHIQSCCYSVPEERKEFFSSYGSSCVFKRKNTWYLNLQETILTQLGTRRIYSGQIQTTDLCTSCSHTDYFSYRKDSHETFGEQIGVISVSSYNTSTI